MFPIMFLPADMAKKYLKQNRKQKVLILGAGPELVTSRWFPSIIRTTEHHVATFSLFSLPMSNPDLICKALTEIYISVHDRWNNIVNDFWIELIYFIEKSVGKNESVSFGEALKRSGFDLSFESLVRHAFDENGKIKNFHLTLQAATIRSLADTSRVAAQEHYQYITMQVSQLFQEHQARLSSPLLVEINRKTLEKFDVILMVTNPAEKHNILWQKDANIQMFTDPAGKRNLVWKKDAKILSVLAMHL